MKDVETGQRGFVITGRAQDLEPYASGMGKIGPTLEKLRNWSLRIRPRPSEWREIRQAIEAKIAVVRQTIEIRRNSGEAPARDPDLSDRGKYAMDRLRILVAQAQKPRVLIFSAGRPNCQGPKDRCSDLCPCPASRVGPSGSDLHHNYSQSPRSETSARELRRSEEQYRQTAANCRLFRTEFPPYCLTSIAKVGLSGRIRSMSAG